MSDSEFEIYLSLLQRLLRLSARQRAEIAEELRDHLEERCEELVRAGYSRAEAIKAALDEFGDAAELAQQFTQIALQRRRRLIMRWSIATTVAVAGLLLLLSTFWPVSEPPENGVQLAAQPAKAAKKQPPAEKSKPRKLVSTWDPARARDELERKLMQPMTLELKDVPLDDVVDFVREVLEANVMFDYKSLEKAGIVPSGTNVSITVNNTSAANALDLVLEPLGLGFSVREGVILIKSKEALASDMEVRVYDCADLIKAATQRLGSALAAAPGARGREAGYGIAGALSTRGYAASMFGAGRGHAGGAFGGAGAFDMRGAGGVAAHEVAAMYGSAAPQNKRVAEPAVKRKKQEEQVREPGTASTAAGSLRSYHMYGGLGALGGGMGMPKGPKPQHCTIEALAEVLLECTDGQWEVIDGKGGGIAWFGTTLVVRQTYRVHRQIAEILDMLRQAYGVKTSEQPKR